MVSIFVIFASVTVIITFVIWWQNRDKRKLFNELKPNLKRWPILGHACYFIGSEEHCMSSLIMLGETALKKGGSVCVWLVNKLVYVTADGADAEFLLTTLLEKDDPMKVMICVGYNLFFAPVRIWRPHRKTIAPVFSVKRVLDSAEVHLNHADILADQLKAVVGDNFCLETHIAAYNMDSIGETILGAKLYTQRTNQHSFLDALSDITLVTGYRILQPWLQNEFFFKFSSLHSVIERTSSYLKGFIKQHISELRQVLQQSKTNVSKEDRPESILEKLIYLSEEGKGLNELELHDETLGLTLAAVDTTVAGLTLTLWLLARHPDVQEKLYSELRDYFGDSKTPAKGEDFPHLKYLDAVMKESLRLLPPVPLLIRKVFQPLTLPSGRTLLPGMGAYVNVWSVHRNPKYWGPDAEEFRPERFFESINHTAYMPFGKGARSCIGLRYAQMSMKSALLSVVRRYRFTLPPGSEELKLKYAVTMKPALKHLVQVELRE